jgi:hypothetical protein
MEKSNQAGGRRGPVGPMDGVRRPAPWLWLVAGALTRSRCRKFKGRPRDNKTIGSVRPRLRTPDAARRFPNCWKMTRPKICAERVLARVVRKEETEPCHSVSFRKDTSGLSGRIRLSPQSSGEYRWPRSRHCLVSELGINPRPTNRYVVRATFPSSLRKADPNLLGLAETTV